MLDAIATVGDGKPTGDTWKDAELVVDRASDVAHSAEEWYLADQVRRGIKEVEAHARHAA